MSDTRERSEKSSQDSSNNSSTSLTRRAFIYGGGSAIAGTAGYTYFTNQNEFGEFEIGIEDKIPFVHKLSFVKYYSPVLHQKANNIDETAEEQITGRSVAAKDNKILKDLDYYTDDEVFASIEEGRGLVGQPDEITRLLDWQHYASLKMGIKAGGYMSDIQQYLEKDLQEQYANNSAEPFHEAMEITYDIAGPQFDINPQSDERDDQLIGMELYMLANGGMAGRYFNTTEIRQYARGTVQNLAEDLEEESTQEGGFSFYL
jgi:hypothetical protein